MERFTAQQLLELFFTLYRPLTGVDTGNLVSLVEFRPGDIIAVTVGTLVSYRVWYEAVGYTRAYRRERESFFAVRTNLMAPRPPVNYVYFRSIGFPLQQPLLNACQSADTPVNTSTFLMLFPYANGEIQTVLLIFIAQRAMPVNTVINLGLGADGRDNRK